MLSPQHLQNFVSPSRIPQLHTLFLQTPEVSVESPPLLRQLCLLSTSKGRGGRGLETPDSCLPPFPGSRPASPVPGGGPHWSMRQRPASRASGPAVQFWPSAKRSSRLVPPAGSTSQKAEPIALIRALTLGRARARTSTWTLNAPSTALSLRPPSGLKGAFSPPGDTYNERPIG